MKKITQTTLTMEMQPKSIQKTCLTLSSSLEDFLAKLSVLLENEEDFNDTRGTLFFEIARILKDKRPRYFLLENVRNLLSHNNGKTFQTILKVLSDLGYNVQWKIYNSKDYQVPQNRERIFIKGYLREKCRPKVLSFRENKEEGSTVIMMKNGLNILEENWDLEKCVGSPRSHASKTNGDVSPCLTANNYGCSTPILQFKNNTGEDDYLIRRLTPIECERLQGFPDDWTKYGKDGELISDTQRYKCLGNAVTTNVITAITDEMFGDSNG